MQRLVPALFAALLTLPLNSPALAITTQSSKPVTVSFVAAFQPTFSGTLPYTGTMQLTFQKGIINGTYRDMSIQPGAPFSGQTIVPVTGGVSGNRIHLQIGSSFSLMNGTITPDGTISGTASWHGRLFSFLAKVGKPGQPSPSGR